MAFDGRDLILERQFAFLQTLDLECVRRTIFRKRGYGFVEIAMFCFKVEKFGFQLGFLAHGSPIVCCGIIAHFRYLNRGGEGEDERTV